MKLRVTLFLDPKTKLKKPTTFNIAEGRYKPAIYYFTKSSIKSTDFLYASLSFQ